MCSHVVEFLVLFINKFAPLCALWSHVVESLYRYF